MGMAVQGPRRTGAQFAHLPPLPGTLDWVHAVAGWVFSRLPIPGETKTGEAEQHHDPRFADAHGIAPEPGQALWDMLSQSAAAKAQLV
jgi:hypothetical protein